MRRDTINRIWAGALAVTTGWLIPTTAVRFDLWVVNGRTGIVYAWAYVALLAAIAVRPSSLLLHRAALPAGLLFWFGRAINGLPRALTDGGPTWAAVSQAVGTGTLLFALHLYTVRSLAAEQALANRIPSTPAAPPARAAR